MNHEEEANPQSQPEEELSIEEIIDLILGPQEEEEEAPTGKDQQTGSAAPGEPAVSQSPIQTDEDPAIEGDEADAAATIPLPGKPRWPLWQGLLNLSLLGILAGACIAVALAYWAPASISIVPQAHQITTVTSVTVLKASTADVSKQYVAGRRLPTITLSQTTTIATTGKGHREAQAARGVIAFYNAALFPQSCPQAPCWWEPVGSRSSPTRSPSSGRLACNQWTHQRLCTRSAGGT